MEKTKREHNAPLISEKIWNEIPEKFPIVQPIMLKLQSKMNEVLYFFPILIYTSKTLHHK